MSTYLRKCLDIAPSAILDPGAINDYRILRLMPWWPALRATTSHIRFLADWPSVHPKGDLPIGTGITDRNRDAADCLAAMDAQIKAATEDGMQVIVMPYRYPRWTNGTVGIVGGTPQDDAFFPEDRLPRLSVYLDWIEGRATRKPTWRDVLYRMPLDGFGPDSAWASYVRWLWDRYVAQAPKYGRASYFEVVNEPNLQIWPQHSAVDTDVVVERFGIDGTTVVSIPAVADMMATMDGIAREYGGTVPCLAPSTSDTDVQVNVRTTTIAHRSPYTTTTQTFVEPLLDELRARGFAGGDHWIWSYHNYSDVERAQSHVVHLRRALGAGGWNGRQLDGGPEVYCTEGGCRLSGANTRFRPSPKVDLSAAEQKRYQGLILTEALSRHHFAKGVGAGVGMLTQYLTFTDVNFDSGLLDAAAVGGAPRPALDAWSAMPEYTAPVAPRADWAVQL